MRTKSSEDWTEERSVGRREADGGVCVYHGIYHNTVEDIKQGCINHLEASKKEFEKVNETIRAVGRNKLDGWIFKLFVGSLVSILLFMGAISLPKLMTLAETIVKIDTNQQHLLQEFGVKPVKE